MEKQFNLGGRKRLVVYIDAFNVLGWANIIANEDDVYIWYPAAENIPEGSKSVSNYGQITNTQGIRVIKLSFRFLF